MLIVLTNDTNTMCEKIQLNVGNKHIIFTITIDITIVV